MVPAKRTGMVQLLPTPKGQSRNRWFLHGTTTSHPKGPEQEPLVPDLQTLEAEIERNKGRSLLMGRDLRTIREDPQKGYRSTGLTWDKYCRARFRFGKRAADYYISAWVAPQNCGVPGEFSARGFRPLNRITPKAPTEARATCVGT